MRSIKLDQAVEMIPDGASLMVGGFLGIGSPELVIDELVRQQKKNLTIIANDTARPGIGVGKLVSANAVSKAVVSHIGLNREAQQQMMSGGMIIELVPQGTLIERIRRAVSEHLPTQATVAVVSRGRSGRGFRLIVLLLSRFFLGLGLGILRESGAADNERHAQHQRQQEIWRGFGSSHRHCRFLRSRPMVASLRHRKPGDEFIA